MAEFKQLLGIVKQAPPVDGVSPVDILQFPRPFPRVLRKMARGAGLTEEELAASFDVSVKEARQLCEPLVEKGYVTAVEAEDGVLHYRVHFARMRGHKIPDNL